MVNAVWLAFAQVGIVPAYLMLINVCDKCHEADDDSSANVKDDPHNIETYDNILAEC